MRVFVLLMFLWAKLPEIEMMMWYCNDCVGGCSGDDVETKQAEEEDLEEGELLDDGEGDEIVKQEESETVEPVIPSLLDMKISPPRNGKTVFTKHNTV